MASKPKKVKLSGKMVFKKNDPTGVVFSLEDSENLDVANVRIDDLSILPDGFTPEWFDVEGEWTMEFSFKRQPFPPRGKAS